VKQIDRNEGKEYHDNDANEDKSHLSGHGPSDSDDRIAAPRSRERKERLLNDSRSRPYMKQEEDELADLAEEKEGGGLRRRRRSNTEEGREEESWTTWCT